MPKFTSDAMDVITDPDVEAVWICSPSQFHADQIKACAANGKHVFCEKPPCLDEAGLASIVAAVKEAPGRMLTVGYNRRFAPMARRLRDHFASA